MENERTARQIRSQATEFRAVSSDEGKFIEGYFSVFGGVYECFPGGTESVDAHAFDDALADDIRCLTNHDTRLVLGRNKSGTLELKVDSRGLWGRTRINEDDLDAKNLYARVQRGDVSQCSFGFEILAEEVDFKDDGSIHWTIKAVKLYEVSVVTFPAYKDTEVTARKEQFDQMKKRQVQAWQETMKARLRNGIKTVVDK